MLSQKGCKRFRACRCRRHIRERSGDGCSYSWWRQRGLIVPHRPLEMSPDLLITRSAVSFPIGTLDGTVEKERQEMVAMVRKNSINTVPKKNMCRISTRSYVGDPSQKNTYRLCFQSAVEKIGNFLWKSPFSCPNIGNKVRRK